MNIIAIEYCPSTTRGGSERSYLDVLTGLRKKGHNVTLGYLVEGDLLEKYETAGVRTLKIGTFMLRSGRKLNDFFLIICSVIKLRVYRRAVVYTNFVEAFPLAFLLKIFCGFKIISHVRLQFHASYTRQIRWAGRYVDLLILINKNSKSLFEREFGLYGKVSVICNGIYIPDQLPVIGTKHVSKKMQLLYLGRLDPDKGLNDLIVLIAELKKRKLFDFTLHLTGGYISSYSGDYKEKLRQLIVQSGVEDVIRINPPIENPIEYISQFDLFIFPSKWEAFGRTVAEAILAGTPVLARSVGMVNEMMVDNPDFIFYTDEALLTKIIQFYNSEIKFNFMEARSTIATHFNKDRMIREVEEKLSIHG